MGLNATVWPNWRWLDSSPQPNVTGRYQNWGYFMPQNILEPNNIFGGEHCVGANSSERVAATGAWGWADMRCNLSFPFVCKTMGAQLRQLVLGARSCGRCLGNAFCHASHHVLFPSSTSPARENPCLTRATVQCICCAGDGAWTYYSNTTRHTYVFNSTATTQQQAELGCQAAGGHLLSYTSRQEQREVEQYFISTGRLIPAFHRSYWIGLR